MKTRAWIEESAMKVLRPVGHRQAWPPLAMMLMFSPGAAMGREEQADPGARSTYEFLERVEEEIGQAAFDQVPYPHALALAESLTFIDRDSCTADCFVGHLHHVQSVKTRFYRSSPLTDDEVKADLLPFRIRNEFTKPDWMQGLGGTMAPLTKEATTAEAAADRIFRWIHGELTLLDPAVSYPIPSRGELDPLSVLKGKHGTELDIAIFGAAALRSAGVAARLVWAPALRGECGGKVWLEYLAEDRTWKPWVPSFGAEADHLAAYRKRLGGKTVLVMARPANPMEVTDSYVATLALHIGTDELEVTCSLLVQGSQGLMPARGIELEMMKNERTVRIGRGPVIVAASFANKRFALLPLVPATDCEAISITAQNGELISQPASNPPTTQSP